MLTGVLSLRERDDTDSTEPAVLSPGVPASAHRAEGTGRHPDLPAGLRRRASLCPRLGFSRCVCRNVIVTNCLKLQSVLSKVRPGACGSLTAPGHTLAHAHQRPVHMQVHADQRSSVASWPGSVFTGLHPQCASCSLCGVGGGSRPLG